MTKLVRVSRKTYEKLHVLAGRLQVRHKKPVSLDETINHLLKNSKKTQKQAEKSKNDQKMKDFARLEVG